MIDHYKDSDHVTPIEKQLFFQHHYHLCEIARILYKNALVLNKRGCEIINLNSKDPIEIKVDSNVTIRVNNSGIYVHIKKIH